MGCLGVIVAIILFSWGHWIMGLIVVIISLSIGGSND